MKRIFFTGLFALTCIAAGFMLATGWETPTAISAQPFNTQSIAVPAASVPLVDDEGNSPFVLVAEKVQPVVVNIQAEKEIAGHKNLPFDMFDFGPFFGEPPRSQGSSPMPRSFQEGASKKTIVCARSKTTRFLSWKRIGMTNSTSVRT